jgi:hypothetical protein
MSDDDFLSDVWKVLALHVGTGVADRELLQLRHKWGGARLYHKKAPALPTQLPLAQGLASGKSVREACAEIGCSPRWGRYLAARKLSR